VKRRSSPSTRAGHSALELLLAHLPPRLLAARPLVEVREELFDSPERTFWRAVRRCPQLER
jgi:hypothetical protein